MLDVDEERGISQASFGFGDVPVRFESADRTWLSYLHRRYGNFSTSSERESFIIRFEPTTADLPRDLVSPLAARLETVHCEPGSGGYRAITESSECEIDLRARRATLRGPSAMYPLDNVLRHLLPLLWEQGLILHSALIEDGEGGSVLACGPSGAGKSTIARLSRGRALADELAGVTLEEGPAVAVALPYWEARPGRARLRAILHLQQGVSHRLEPLRPEEALRRLAAQVLWPVWEERAMARTFAHFAEIAESVPAFHLRFALQEDVWSFLDKEVR